MKLQDIIEASANRMKDVTVHIQSNFGWVTIHDLTGVQEDIFLEGHEGSAFISEVNKIWEETGDLDKNTIALHLAEQYVENIWS